MAIKLSTWAEIVGSIAIVLSLVFVGIEIRQSTAVNSAQAVSDLNALIIGHADLFLDNEELWEITKRGDANIEELSPSEFDRYVLITQRFWNIEEAAFTHLFPWAAGSI